MIEINSKPGTKVIYYNCNSVGEERIKEYANEFLKNGNVYTVELFRTGCVGLAEVPGELFETDLFEYKDQPKDNIVTYTDEELYNCCDDQLKHLMRLQEKKDVNLSLQQQDLVKALWSNPNKEKTWQRYQSKN